jgi:hypothetical protein
MRLIAEKLERKGYLTSWAARSMSEEQLSALWLIAGLMAWSLGGTFAHVVAIILFVKSVTDGLTAITIAAIAASGGKRRSTANDHDQQA